MFGGSDIFVLIIVFLAILTVFLAVKTVPQGYNAADNCIENFC